MVLIQTPLKWNMLSGMSCMAHSFREGAITGKISIFK
jgi:hypothetical protein